MTSLFRPVFPKSVLYVLKTCNVTCAVWLVYIRHIRRTKTCLHSELRRKKTAGRNKRQLLT